MRHVIRVAALFMVAALAMSLNAYAAPGEYSGTMEMTSGGNTTKSKLYVKGKLQRMEMQGAEGTVSIVRGDKKVVWMLMPEQMMYMEMPMSGQNSNPVTANNIEVSREKLGDETVDGHPCSKEKVTVKDSDGKTSTMYQWCAKDMGGLPVKAEAVDGSWKYMLRDAETGPQDASLFEVPDGYSKFDMGGMGGGRGMPRMPGRR